MSKSRPAKGRDNAKNKPDSPPAADPGALMATVTPASISKGRARTFRVVAIALPFILLGLIEAGFRLFSGSHGELDPYINISKMTVFSRTVINGAEYYNITHTNVLGGSEVHFLVHKPANTFRVFCVGSSACAGWPHGRDETFSAYLQQALQTAYPGKTIEVINAAGHGFAAYRTRRVLDQAMDLQPDLVLVWEGNNEFMEDRNYAPPAAGIVALACRLRTVQWLRDELMQTRMSGAGLKEPEKFFFAKAHAQALRLRADPYQFSQVEAHFRDSFQEMVDQAERHQVPLILCTVPVNLRDWVPNVSSNRLTGAALSQWQQLYNAGRSGLLTGDNKRGIEAMRQAIALEPEHGESYFWLGHLLEADGQREAAWQAFSKARDLDMNPFRALSSFNDTVKSLAEKNQGKGVYLLDLDRILADSTTNAAPGFDFFLDYVHPTKPANLIVARSAYQLIVQAGWLPGKPAVDQFTYHERPFGPHGEPYEEFDDPAMYPEMIELAAQNRQLQHVLDLSADLMRVRLGRRPSGPDDPEFKEVPAEFAEHYSVIWHYLDVGRRTALNQPVTAQETQDAQQQLEAVYEKWFPYGKL